jgi:DNA-binding response OmpR family regulator
MAKRVLVVDDHVDTVQSTVIFFRAAGYDARGCYNGQDALRAIRDFDPDAVVMDIGMPGMSGWEAARAIRGEFPGRRPLLIAITGEYKGGADLIVTKMNGFDHYFLKPTAPAKLIELIEAA